MNLRAPLTKAGREYSLLWGEDFVDPGFRSKLRAWCEAGKIAHDLSHVRALSAEELPAEERALGEALAAELLARPAIMGVFDEGCMGMFNAIIPDHLLNPVGVFKERLSQSASYHAMTRVRDEDALAVRAWYDKAGITFRTGPNEASDLTDGQILEQCRCTSPRRGSPTSSGAIASASSISKVSRISPRRRTWWRER